MSKNYIKKLLLSEASERTKDIVKTASVDKPFILTYLLSEAEEKFGFMKVAGGMSGTSNLAFSDNTDWRPLNLEDHPRIGAIVKEIETTFGGSRGRVFYKINEVKKAIPRGIVAVQNIIDQDANVDLSKWWSPGAENTKDENVDPRDGRAPNIYFRYEYRRTVFPNHNKEGLRKSTSAIKFFDQILKENLPELQGKGLADFIKALEDNDIPLAPFYQKSFFEKSKGFINAQDMVAFVEQQLNVQTADTNLFNQFPGVFDRNTGRRIPGKTIPVTGGAGHKTIVPIRTIKSETDVVTQSGDTEFPRDFLDYIPYPSILIKAIGYKGLAYDLNEEAVGIAVDALAKKYIKLNNLHVNPPANMPLEKEKYEAVIDFFANMKNRILFTWHNRCFDTVAAQDYYSKFSQGTAAHLFSDNIKAYPLKERMFAEAISGLPVYIRPKLDRGKYQPCKRCGGEMVINDGILVCSKCGEKETTQDILGGKQKKSEESKILKNISRTNVCPVLTLEELKMLYRCLNVPKPPEQLQAIPADMRRIISVRNVPRSEEADLSKRVMSENEFFLPTKSGVFADNGWDVFNGMKMPMAPQVRKVATGDMFWDRDNGNFGRNHLVKNWTNKQGTKGLKIIVKNWGEWCARLIEILRRVDLLGAVSQGVNEDNPNTGYVRTLAEAVDNVIGKQGTLRRTGAENFLDIVAKYPEFNALSDNHLSKSMASEIELIYALDKDLSQGRDRFQPESLGINLSDIYELSADGPQSELEQKILSIVSGFKNQRIAAFTAARDAYVVAIHLLKRYKSNVNADRRNLSYDVLTRCLSYLVEPLYKLAAVNPNDNINSDISLADLTGFLKRTGRSTDKLGYSDTDSYTQIRQNDYSSITRPVFKSSPHLNIGYYIAKTMDLINGIMERSCVTKAVGSDKYVWYGRNYGTSTGKGGPGQVYLGVKYAYRPKLTNDPDLEKKIKYWLGKYTVTPSKATFYPTTEHPQRGNKMEPLTPDDRANAFNLEIMEDVKYWMGSASSQAKWLKNIDHAQGLPFRLMLDMFIQRWPDIEQQTGEIINPLNVNMNRLEKAIHGAMDKVRREVNQPTTPPEQPAPEPTTPTIPPALPPGPTASSVMKLVTAEGATDIQTGDIFIPFRITFKGVIYEPDEIYESVREGVDQMLAGTKPQSQAKSTVEPPPVAQPAQPATPATTPVVQPAPSAPTPVRELPQFEVDEEPKTMPKQIDRITKDKGNRRLIVNRGEIADRIIKVCNQLDTKQETGLSDKLDLLLQHILSEGEQNVS